MQDQFFLDGITEFWNIAFPKFCPKCERTFETLQEFLQSTQAIPNEEKPAEYPSDGSGDQIGIFRNCQCGSTLSILVPNRRDTSPSGVRRRKAFGAMFDRLVQANVPRREARARLLKILQSGNLENLAARLTSLE